MQVLPFPSIVVGSSNDYLASADVVEAMAKAWGSEWVNMGEVGHLNLAAGFGYWSQAEEFIRQLDQI